MRRNDNYYFPNTEKVGDIIFHYSARINGSFVKEVKKDIEVAINKLKKYRNINLKDAMQTDPMHIFIYPDIKSFRMIFGHEMQKVETKQMHFMMSNNIETRYILTDDMGNIHMVLPQGRSTSIYKTFSSELVSIIVGQYIAVDPKKEYELKNAVKRYIQSEREKEELAKKKEEEEQEAQEEIEENEEELDDLEELAEEELQEELEKLDEEELVGRLEELDEMSDEELNEMVDVQNGIEEQEELPAWMTYGWRAYVCGRLSNISNRKRFENLVKKNKIPKPTSINGKKIDSELDLDVATLSVEYIVKVYGYGSFVKLCSEPDNIKGIFYKANAINNKMAKERLNLEIKEYIRAKLTPVKVAEAIEMSEQGSKVVYKDKDKDYSKSLDVEKRLNV